jgi:predicted acetyltransferase
MIEFRPPAEDDRDAVMRLAQLAFPVPTAHLEDRVRHLRLERYVGAYERGRLIATAQAHPLQQWFGGQPVPCAGIASVTAAPERRGMGIVSELMREVLRRERDRGAMVSCLFPATAPVYRRLGYEYAGTYTEYTAKLRSLPPSKAGLVEAFEGEDHEPLRECFRRFAAAHNALVDGEAPDWWPSRILRRVGPDTVAHAVTVAGESGVEGYAAFTREDVEHGFALSCTHLVATTRAALEALYGYFRRFQGIGRELRWQGPPADPAVFLFTEQSVETAFTFRFMLRLLDVQGALEARGYPDVEGTATITVADDLFEENDATFELTAGGGKVRAEVVDRQSRTRLSIGMLSALYSGYAAPIELVRLGVLDADDPAMPVLTLLFAGPSPWMPDFF